MHEEAERPAVTGRGWLGRKITPGGWSQASRPSFDPLNPTPPVEMHGMCVCGGLDSDCLSSKLGRVSKLREELEKIF